MRLDIYRRAESDGKFSYLAVPETRNIPEEATNTDWEVEARAFEVDDNAEPTTTSTTSAASWTKKAMR